MVRTAWAILAAGAYGALLLLTFAASSRPDNFKFGTTEGLAFAALILLQPFSQKYTLVVLLWPAMVAGRLCRNHPARGLLYAAAGLSAAQPVMQGAAAQRLMQALGVDFVVTALLAGFLVAAILKPATAPDAEYRYYSPGTRTP
jgi:hypothetical protein